MSGPALTAGTTVTGTCQYYSISEHFYMQVLYSGQGVTDGYGYVWADSLKHAAAGHCYRANYEGNYSAYPVGTAPCPTASSDKAP